jgi:hypothetical protein
MSNKPENYQPGAKLPIVKASFDLEATKLNYQHLLQNLSAITVTRDNINEDLVKDGREVLKALEAEKDRQSAEPLQWHRDVMVVYKDAKTPIEEQVNRILAEKKALAAILKSEQDAQIAEQNRINAAKAAIVNFCNSVAVKISEANTDDDIVSIEKMIGLEKTKVKLYQEFLPDLILQIDGLRPQIKEQKETVRKLQQAIEDEKKAIETNDLVALTSLKEKKEYLEQEIAERGIRIHEKAFEQASTIEIIAPETAESVPKGRTNWKFRVDDIKFLQKKMPHMVKLVPNDEAIKLQLETMKKDGSLTNQDSVQWNGVTFFNDKLFNR